MAWASVVSPLEIFAADEVGRRRHWSDEDKVRIIEERLRGFRQGSVTARRYGISRSLLSIWRREYRSGTLGAPKAGRGFVPLVMEGAPPASVELPSREAEAVGADPAEQEQVTWMDQIYIGVDVAKAWLDIYHPA